MKAAIRLATSLTLSLVLLLLAGDACLSRPVNPTPIAPSQPAPEISTIDKTPPQTTIIRAVAETITSDNITLEWTATDDITSTDKITYSYYLQGNDTGYSPFSSNTTKTYTDLTDGSYIFYVKSRDQAGNISAPVTVEFTVTVPTPEEITQTPNPVVSTLLIEPNSDVSRIAVGYDGTVYALDSHHARLYKSDHGGYGWADISRDIGAAGPWTELAVAPDNPQVVAVVTNGGTEVFVSVDGGANFGATGLGGNLGGGEIVKCLTISSDYGRRDIAVGTSRGAGNGRVFVNIMDGFPSGWKDVSTGAAGWMAADIFAIQYSPGFAADATLLVVAATGPAPATDNTYLYIGTRDLGGNTTTWNSSSGYPVQISQSGQDTPGTPLTYADIALPADYLGTSPASRHVYACWSDNPPGSTSGGNPNDDVYRIDDTVCYRLMAHIDTVCSIAHYGMFSRGKLLAGAGTSSTVSLFQGPQVYFTPNPNAQYPTWQNSQKPPTGPAQARVAWSADGVAAYCGTSSVRGSSNDQSAFSISTNNGFTWNQIGLIDL
jgi:hypothetical protein